MYDPKTIYERLRIGGNVRNDAIAELRMFLLRGLSKSLTNRYGQPFSAEDVVQDALIKILNSLHQFEGRSQFTTWAMTVATRIGISSLRRKYHKDVSMEAFQDDGGYKIDISVAENVFDEDDRSELISKLQYLIDTELTDRQRMAIRAYLAGYSTDGIAERVGTTRNAVYKLVHDARMKLKEGLQKHGISADDVQLTFA